MLRTTTAILCGLYLASSGFAAVDIEEWSGAGSGFYIHGESTIEITAAGTYYFQSYDGATPADIDDIYIAEGGVAGTVTIYIYQDPQDGDGPGAANVKQIDLSGATTGNLGSLYISGDLAQVDDVDCDNVLGDIDVGGNLAYNDIDVIYDIDGDITIEGLLLGDIEAETLQNVTVSGEGTHTGNITVDGGFVEIITIGDPEGDPSVMQGSISIGGDFQGNGDGYGGGGVIEIYGDMEGAFAFDEDVHGRILIHGDFTNDMTIDREFGTTTWLWHHPKIEIDGDFGDSGTDVISIGYGFTLTYGIRDGKIIIHGDMGGRILVDDGFHEGEIYIDRSLKNSTGNETDEIEVGPMTYGNDSSDDDSIGISVDYDGYDSSDYWHDDATININGTDYDDDTVGVPAVHLWCISSCRGDLDNDGGLDMDDVGIFLNQLYDQNNDYDPNAYLEAYPGLGGSLYYHGDASGNGAIDAEIDAGSPLPDQNAVTYLGTEECCVQDWSFCVTDLDCDGDTDMTDLSILLAHYGMTSGVDREDGDIDGDGDVDLPDLATLLGQYGESCDCSGAEDGGGGGGMDGSYADISVEAYNTGGYSGGGFSGEVAHFILDLEMEVLDPNSDDWVATGVRLSAFNDAAFRLSSTATTPDAYATFVAAPWTSLPGSATASVAGAYAPASSSARFTTSAINLGWYDCASSNDGPATVMRIVIDVSEVDGADVSGGFGSVYFGLQRDQNDIKVATLVASGTYTAGSAPAEESLSGDFWVTGE